MQGTKYVIQNDSSLQLSISLLFNNDIVGSSNFSALRFVSCHGNVNQEKWLLPSSNAWAVSMTNPPPPLKSVQFRIPFVGVKGLPMDVWRLVCQNCFVSGRPAFEILTGVFFILTWFVCSFPQSLLRKCCDSIWEYFTTASLHTLSNNRPEPVAVATFDRTLLNKTRSLTFASGKVVPTSQHFSFTLSAGRYRNVTFVQICGYD